METVKVKCKKVKGNDTGYYVCNKDEVPKGAQIIKEDDK